VKDWNFDAEPFDRRCHEAWMGADVDEPSTRSKDTVDFRENRTRIIEVGMSQHRDDGVKRIIFEGHVRGIGLNELGVDPPRDCQLISRYIYTHNLPAGGHQSRDREACPAA
jgi:hypothetical protein